MGKQSKLNSRTTRAKKVADVFSKDLIETFATTHRSSKLEGRCWSLAAANVHRLTSFKIHLESWELFVKHVRNEQANVEWQIIPFTVTIDNLILLKSKLITCPSNGVPRRELFREQGWNLALAWWNYKTLGNQSQKGKQHHLNLRAVRKSMTINTGPQELG